LQRNEEAYARCCVVCNETAELIHRILKGDRHVERNSEENTGKLSETISEYKRMFHLQYTYKELLLIFMSNKHEIIL